MILISGIERPIQYFHVLRDSLVERKSRHKGIKAAQMLSRLNRAHPRKHDAFVHDFMNDSHTIQQPFADC